MSCGWSLTRLQAKIDRAHFMQFLSHQVILEISYELQS